MTERWIIREGQVVERDGSAVVRFRAGCAGPGRCVCVPGERDVALEVLGLDAAATAGQRVSVAVTSAALSRLALTLFALPLAALLAGAWLGRAVAAGSAGAAEVWPAGLGLTALAGTLILVTRRSGALVRSLKVNARLKRTDS
ncbi:MAG: SoxR reducing system RseC family protein [Pseudomonadales bacterium]